MGYQKQRRIRDYSTITVAADKGNGYKPGKNALAVLMSVLPAEVIARSPSPRIVREVIENDIATIFLEGIEGYSKAEFIRHSSCEHWSLWQLIEM